MSPTEIQLLALHKSPVIPLKDVCEKYLGRSVQLATREAALNLLPFPAFKASDSNKSPWVVHVSELAKYIDERAQEASTSWTKSQL